MIWGRLYGTPDVRLMQKPCKIIITRRPNNGVVKVLFACPVIITDHTIPRVSNHGKDEIILHRAGIHNPVNIAQGAVFPQSPSRRQIRQSFATFLGLGRITYDNIICFGPRLKRERHGCATGFRRMNKNIAPRV